MLAAPKKQLTADLTKCETFILDSIFYKKQRTVKCILECSLVSGPECRGDCLILILLWCFKEADTSGKLPKAPSPGPQGWKKEGGLHDSSNTTTTHSPSSSPSSPAQSLLKMAEAVAPLLLGHCEWLLHLDFATIVDNDVFERLITAVCLCALHLPHHVLQEIKKQQHAIRDRTHF